MNYAFKWMLSAAVMLAALMPGPASAHAPLPDFHARATSEIFTPSIARACGVEENLYQAFAANPVGNMDPDGRAVETIVDVASIGWSAVDLWRDPSWGNAGYLAWDLAATAVPFLPGSYVAKGGKLALKAKKCAAPAKSIVIGENMKRVETAAKHLGAETFQGCGMEANRAWIQMKRAQGYDIYDIGPDFTRRLERVQDGIRPDSPFYNMERMESAGYENYQKLFDRSGKFQGGVSGLDY